MKLKPIYKRVLVISDLHIPYEHPDALRFLRAIKKKFKPDFSLSVGDEVDWHSVSMHDKDPDLMSAGDELVAIRNKLKPYYKLFPELVILDSNHGSLIKRRAFKYGLPKEVLKSYNDILNAPTGWHWVQDLIFKTPLGPVFATHGKTGTPLKLCSQYGMSSLQGHFHSKAQISYASTPERLLWDMHVGCLIDPKSNAFAYDRQNLKRPVISVAIIIEGIPQIIPMLLLKNGRWNGKL